MLGMNSQLWLSLRKLGAFGNVKRRLRVTAEARCVTKVAHFFNFFRENVAHVN